MASRSSCSLIQAHLRVMHQFHQPLDDAIRVAFRQLARFSRPAGSEALDAVMAQVAISFVR